MTNEETMLQIMDLKNYLKTEGYHKAQRELDGKALNIAIEALKKQLPKRPLKQRYVNKELIGVCPSCRLQWDVAFYQRHCSNCGQKLNWS